MGLRFRRSMRVFPGVRLNFSSRGISTTVGVRGLSVNVGPRGTYINAGIPGTGISFRERVGSNSTTPLPATARPHQLVPSDHWDYPGTVPDASSIPHPLVGEI